MKPPRLRHGDVIGMIAPASPAPDPARVEAAVRYVEGLGYRVRIGEHTGAQRGYLAGTDAERATDLNAMLNDPEVRAIFALRGGYGSPRLLPLVDYEAARRHPKIFVGHSDLTALQLALYRCADWITFSGPMLVPDFGGPRDPYTEEHFWRLLTSAARAGVLPNPPDQPAIPRRAGRATGRLLAGNLSLILSAFGTPFCPFFRGALLVVEEVNEPLHRVDRMFTQLRNAGVFSQIRGLGLGRFTRCTPFAPEQPHLTLEQIFADLVTWLEVPVLDGIQYGHVTRKLTLPLGVRARLDADRGSLELLEAAVT